MRELPQLRDRLTRTAMPDGQRVRMQPMAVDLPQATREFGFPPKYGEHTRCVLAEAGLGDAEVAALYGAGVVA